MSPENSIRLYQALADSGVVSELHLFEDGGHGVGICKAGNSDLSNWPDSCTNWLHRHGLTDKYIEIDSATNSRAENTRGSSNQINIYPNPNTGVFSISLDADKLDNTQFRMVNCLGQVVYTGKLQKQNGNYSCLVNKNNFNPRSYYFHMIANGLVLTKHLFIE